MDQTMLPLVAAQVEAGPDALKFMNENKAMIASFGRQKTKKVPKEIVEGQDGA